MDIEKALWDARIDLLTASDRLDKPEVAASIIANTIEKLKEVGLALAAATPPTD